jgi:RNA polymerase sigma-70 factor (ECF subfamily)
MTSQDRRPEDFQITELIVAAAKNGDHQAIGAVASDAFRRIVSFYRYTGLNPDDAEDLSADAVERIISRLPTLKKVSAYDAWMWAITRNLLRSWWRSQKLRDAQEPISPAPIPPDEIAETHEEHEQIVFALQTLSTKDRELLWLREVLELDYRSIAQRVESNAGSVRVACHRARQRLESAYRSLESDQT